MYFSALLLLSRPLTLQNSNSHRHGQKMEISIVLVQTWRPGNIGSVARAMKNMGLTDLRLVNPVHPLDDEAEALAAGATDLLESARYFTSVEEAVADRTHILATTARKREAAFPVSFSYDVFDQLKAEGASKVAILFGRERTGLHNHELALAHRLIFIPTSPDYPSINLAQAVQILSYEAFKVISGPDLSQTNDSVPQLQTGNKASSQATEAWLKKLSGVIEQHELVSSRRQAPTEKQLRRLLLNTHPDEHDMEVLSGILAIVDRKLSAPASE